MFMRQLHHIITRVKALFSKTIVIYSVVVLGIAVLVALPKLYQLTTTPPGAVPLHVHGIGEDYFYDLMVIRQGLEGSAEIDQYTTEDTKPAYVHVYYLLLGRIGRFFHASAITMYWIGFAVSLALFVVSAVVLVNVVIPRKYRLLALAVIFFCGPFPPLELSIFGKTFGIGTSWWTNMDQYHRITQMPHHYIGQAGAIFASACAYAWFGSQRGRYAVLAGLSCALGILGYNVPGVVFLASFWFVVFMVVCTGILQRKSWKELFSHMPIWHILVISIPPLMVLAWFWYQMQTLGYPWDSFLAWEANWYNHFPKEIYPYTFPVFLVSFGILPIFMLPAWVRWLKKGNVGTLLVSCMVIVPILLYILAAQRILPVPKIRFTSVSPYVFAGIIATLGISYIDSFFRRHRFYPFFMSIPILILGTYAFFGIKAYWYPQTYSVSYTSIAHFSRTHIGMVEAIENIPPYSRLMVPYGLGTVLPAFTKQKVFVGHIVNTRDVWNKYYLTQQLYAGLMSPDQAREMLHSYKITHVVWEGRAPESYNTFLHEVFFNGYTIYSVVR